METSRFRLVTKGFMVDPGLPQEWKSGAGERDRSGKPKENFLGFIERR